jgi:hypothetical protein
VRRFINPISSRSCITSRIEAERQRRRQQPRDVVRSDRLAIGEVVIEDQAEYFAGAFVERAKLLPPSRAAPGE